MHAQACLGRALTLVDQLQARAQAQAMRAAAVRRTGVLLRAIGTGCGNAG